MEKIYWSIFSLNKENIISISYGKKYVQHSLNFLLFLKKRIFNVHDFVIYHLTADCTRNDLLVSVYEPITQGGQVCDISILQACQRSRGLVVSAVVCTFQMFLTPRV